MRYDAVIIGASADGLAAAVLLARKGLKTVVIERGDRPGGLLQTREFHPGFRASPFADEIAPVPPTIHWELDLSRRGTDFLPAPCSLAHWPDRQHLLMSYDASATNLFLAEVQQIRTQTISRAEMDVPKQRRWPLFLRYDRAAPWPGRTWSAETLSGLLQRSLSDDAGSVAHLAAHALAGRTADPFLKGSALHALAPASGGSGMITGGLERLADALAAAAREAGADIRCGLDVSDLKLDNGRIAYATLADGTEFETRAVISTFDLKRTFLSLFSWKALPKAVVAQAGTFRVAGASARVLFALKARPGSLPPELLRGPIFVAPRLSRFAEANLAWRSGNLASELPTCLRIVSVLDPSLAPPGCAVMTATLGSVPFRLFDGAWTKDRRDGLRNRALVAAESVFPGIAELIIATDVIAPVDMDNALGATDGDLWGGEIAADQMFDLRPWSDPPAPRTPVRGLYLAGPSSPLGPVATCAAGFLAAKAVLSDAGTGR
ncbi:MAG: NAD(P)/FAD-dependent oxidoreductase [Rhizomicrobium sp.]